MLSGVKAWFYGIAAALLLSSMVGIYLKGRFDGWAACQAANVAETHRVLRGSKDIQESDAQQAMRDADADAEFQKKVEQIHDELEDGNRECLSDADSERLRSLWR